MAKPDLGDYIEVKDRIAAFHQQYPEGSLQSAWGVQNPAGEHVLIVCVAKAYRTPDDKRPGIGTASEPFPGKTPYTKDSELMNAETSAWGRALAALGFEVSKSIASREEVAAREDGESPRRGSGVGVQTPQADATGPQKRKITNELKAKFNPEYHAPVKAAYKAHTKGGASDLIEALVNDQISAIFAKAGITAPSDVPVDDEGLPDHQEALGLKADDE